MTDQKKDLTGLMEYAQAMQDAGQAPPAPEGSVMEEQKIESVDSFESLEEYGKNNPPLENPAPGDSTEDPFAVTAPEPEPAFTSLPEPVQPEPAQPEAALEKIKQYSESIAPGKDSVPAAFPFSLMITGRLAPEEQARLLDILSRENMGIREIDLEPQLESGRILIPRISEYAGVMIVSALRSTQAKMRLGPSDSIFATEDTHNAQFEESFDSGERSTRSYTEDHESPAETLPITTAQALPGLERVTVIDVITATGALQSQAVEAESSTEYQELLDALQRELKYKAHRKGATAILNFQVQLTQLRSPSQYRMLVTGTAVKTASRIQN